MTQRTAQLIGFSDACEIKITWNDMVVFHDSVVAPGNKDDLTVLAEWTTDTEILGDIPLVIECLSGSLHFVNIYMNMFASIRQPQLTRQPDWTIYTPTEQELFDDLSQLTDEQITAKYALTRSDISQHITVVEMVSVENNFSQPVNATDLIPCDGKKSITIDDAPYTRVDVVTWPGAYHWPIYQGQIFKCFFQVDAPADAVAIT
jgi:hypothetical protein